MNNDEQTEPRKKTLSCINGALNINRYLSVYVHIYIDNIYVDIYIYNVLHARMGAGSLMPRTNPTREVCITKNVSNNKKSEEIPRACVSRVACQTDNKTLCCCHLGLREGPQ